MSTLLLRVFLLFLLTGFFASPYSISQERELLRVATFNVNYANQDLTQIIGAVDELEADIICFQETTIQLESELKQKMASSHPYFESIGYKGQYLAERFAFASKYELTAVEYSPPTVGLFGVFRAKANWHGRDVSLHNIHLTPVVIKSRTVNAAFSAFNDAESKHKNEIQGILARLNTDELTIVAGDFNSVSTSIAPQSMTDAGWIDSYASHHKNPDTQPTWRWPPLLLRIDYIFHSRHFETVNAKIIRFGGSDHFPCVSELKLK